MSPFPLKSRADSEGDEGALPAIVSTYENMKECINYGSIKSSG